MRTGDFSKVASFRFGEERGFTLMELMTVIFIIGLLVVMLIPAFASVRFRAEKVSCLNNLKGLYVAANARMQDQGSWPQIPPKPGRNPIYANAWISAFAPYGIAPINWVCPGIQRSMGGPNLGDPKSSRVDYIGTSFDAEARSPFKWLRHPWFIENADMHGDGNFVLFASGEISTLGEIRRDTRAQYQ